MGTGIGARVARKEDARLLSGQAKFVRDLKFPRLLEAAYVRSPLAHGRLKSVTIPEKYKDRVFTASNLSDVLPIRPESTLPGYKASQQYPLVKDKVRFVGECIAICVAPTRAEAEDIAEQVIVDIDPLPPLVNASDAKTRDAPRLHDDWDDNLFLTTAFDGDLEFAEKNATVVIEREYNTARQCMNPMEGKGTLSYWDDKAGQLVVYTSTQVPHLIRTGIAQYLQMDQGQVRVIAPDVGGGFGYKCVLQPEELSVSWVARKLKRPVRWVEDRREHLVAGANTRQHHYKLKAYADDRGKLLGIDAEITVDIGAYSVWPFTACLEAAQAGGNLPGPYALEGYRCKTYSVATNKPGFTPYRGVARPGVCFAMELTIDAIARAVGREPADVRRENLVPGSAMPYTNVTGKFYDSGDYQHSVTEAARAIGLEDFRKRQKEARTQGRFLGLGFGTFTEQSAHGTKVFAAWGLPLVPGYEQAMVKLTPSGSVEVRSGNHSFGQGLETTIAQVASEWLTVDIDKINVLMGDTGMTPYSTGAYASRGMVMAGGAVSKAAEELVKRIKIHASHLLQCDAKDVALKDGKALSGAASVDFADIARAWYLRPDQLDEDVDTAGLEVTQGYKPDIDTGVFTYATHAAIVEVDPETGKVSFEDYYVFEDCGRRVNPLILEGQTYGGAAQGIGTALFEEVLYDPSGQPLTSTLADYILPGPAELPHFRLEHSETPSPYTRHGIKGVGEGAAIAPGGAVLNAINDALEPLGVELNELPATPHKILSAIMDADRPEEVAG
ncbi:xanthine dehydrogenase family protein molybdopterin-binding subunit [Ruegeria sp. 2012CJ41-6]|uniref:Xanthine dehydrogenase family protein molybdopterin-binding subunit n=1 Tax=Ruegeria spongiae TaxID=2942209 RepID=A0ABT0Q889_9RHOB|nr:xanthine dehydrogenase family protein molybdopterin-binding subunit [Ruegeria spongiae]MCL6286070.1 xanthine dehydrogenase family protein molybdopterin-binding subunit [Ruegeria spongiae]